MANISLSLTIKESMQFIKTRIFLIKPPSKRNLFYLHCAAFISGSIAGVSLIRHIYYRDKNSPVSAYLFTIVALYYTILAVWNRFKLGLGLVSPLSPYKLSVSRTVIPCPWKKDLSFSFQIPVPETWRVFHVDREKSVTLTAIPKDQRLANHTEEITAHVTLLRSITVESYCKKLNTKASDLGIRFTKIEDLPKTGGIILKDEAINKKSTGTGVQAIIKTHGVFFMIKYSTSLENGDKLCANYLPMLRTAEILHEK